jgi:predicted RNA methylase
MWPHECSTQYVYTYSITITNHQSIYYTFIFLFIQAATVYGDVEGKHCIDLGCGTGMLTVAAAVLGAGHVTGIDIDQDALDIAQRNIGDIFGEDSDDEMPCSIDFVRMDVACPSMPLTCVFPCDTVFTNPPFGTRCKGADVQFLKVAFQLSTGAVYSLHKTSTRSHISKVARSLGATSAEPIAELRYDLPKSYAFHTKDTKDIDVDIWRFELS